jgi:hypothetical protein
MESQFSLCKGHNSSKVDFRPKFNNRWTILPYISIYKKNIPFRRIISGKFRFLGRNPAERHAFLRKVLTFCGKFPLFHASPNQNKTKIVNIFTPSLRLHGVDVWKKTQKSQATVPLTKVTFLLSTESKTLCTNISEIHEKIWTILTFIRALWGVDSTVLLEWMKPHYIFYVGKCYNRSGELICSNLLLCLNNPKITTKMWLYYCSWLWIATMPLWSGLRQVKNHYENVVFGIAYSHLS